MPLTPADILTLSTLLSALLGVVLVPYVVALVVHADWDNAVKRAVALAVSFLVAGLQFLNDYVITGKSDWKELAVTVPLVFLLATVTYNKFWKPVLGPIAELDLISQLLGNRRD